MDEVTIVVVGVILGGLFAGVIPNPFKRIKDKRKADFLKFILDIVSDIL